MQGRSGIKEERRGEDGGRDKTLLQSILGAGNDAIRINGWELNSSIPQYHPPHEA